MKPGEIWHICGITCEDLVLVLWVENGEAYGLSLDCSNHPGYSGLLHFNSAFCIARIEEANPGSMRQVQGIELQEDTANARTFTGQVIREHYYDGPDDVYLQTEKGQVYPLDKFEGKDVKIVITPLRLAHGRR